MITQADSWDQEHKGGNLFHVYSALSLKSYCKVSLLLACQNQRKQREKCCCAKLFYVLKNDELNKLQNQVRNMIITITKDFCVELQLHPLTDF